MHTIRRLKQIDIPRAMLIAVNIPFLILLHLAFVAHVVCTIWFYLAMARSRKEIAQAFAHNYRILIVQLFKPLA